MPTALEMTPKEWGRFNPAKNITAHRAQKEYLADRREKALKVAREAAALLRQNFGAEKVVVFGSLTNEESFTSWSDIDLAAWGISPDNFYLAVAAVTGLSPFFKIDLVEPDNCRKSITEVIYREGVEI